MNRVNRLFCRGPIYLYRLFLVLLTISLAFNALLYLQATSYRETANLAMEAIANVDGVSEENISYIKELKTQIESLEKELENIRKENSAVVPRQSNIAEVTAYTPFAESTGKTEGHPAFNVTWSGFKGGGGVCAADPRYWPMGTALYVEGLGACVVLDTGGAIKGKWRFDYYIPGDERNAVKVALDWGRRNTKVIVLAVPDKHVRANQVQ